MRWINIDIVGDDNLDDKRLSRFVSAVVLLLFVDNLMACMEGTTGISAETVSVLCKVVLGILFLTELPILLKKFTSKLLMFCMMTALVITANFLMFPASGIFFRSTVFTFLTMCFTVYLAMALIWNYDILFRYLILISYIISVLACILLVAVFAGQISGFNDEEYSMGFGYSCLVPILFLIYDFYKKRSVKGIVSIVVLIMVVISYGSRGPLIAIAVFIAYLLCRYIIKSRNILTAILLVAAVVLLIMYYDDLILWLNDILSNAGINSRTLTMMLSGDLNSTSSRDALYEKVREGIHSQPFKIRGINAEWIIIGTYAHNLILELLYQFGLLVGGGILVFILWCAVKTIVFRTESDQNWIQVIFMIAALSDLMVSGSLWTFYIFWLWMSCCLNENNVLKFYIK